MAHATIGERLLRALSRDPASGDPEVSLNSEGRHAPLWLLDRVYPDFQAIVRGKRVLDFGCGVGHQALAMAGLGASEVVGLDSNERVLAMARERMAGSDYRERVRLTASASDLDPNSFDLVLSQNSMEHFPDPSGTLQLMRGLLAPGGKLLVTFGPPWYAPYGAHMRFFTAVPWVQMLFSERTVMRVRASYRDDGAQRYEDVEGGLNRMSVSRMENLIQANGLRIEFRKYECVKRMDFLSHVPLLRELAINHLSFVLAPTSEPLSGTAP